MGYTRYRHDYVTNNFSMNSSHHRQVVRYYEETDWDHRYVWSRGVYQAAHFGIYNTNAQDHKGALLNTNRVMAELAEVAPGMQILDAGCGWGGTSLWLAKEKKVTVTGVNLARYQVEECTEKARKLGLQNQCTFIQSDYCATPFADDQFDVVWSCESLCHAPQKYAFYQEAWRILKPGGKLVIADYQRVARPLATAEEKLLHIWLDGWACIDIDTPAEHHTHATDAGFRQINQHDYSNQVQVSLRNLYVHAARWSWIGRLGTFMRILKPFRGKNVAGTKAMYRTYQQGLWRYALTVCSK